MLTPGFVEWQALHVVVNICFPAAASPAARAGEPLIGSAAIAPTARMLVGISFGFRMSLTFLDEPDRNSRQPLQWGFAPQ
jgi:hypothetical protein